MLRRTFLSWYVVSLINDALRPQLLTMRVLELECRRGVPSAVSRAQHSSRGVEMRPASGCLLTRHGADTLATACRVVEAGVYDECE